ncbi:hypothetical protein ONE63_000353 [Megalurothrips usitatus]|uniref:Cadherin-related family member 1 n=1 Tax=Megalurothrips usitatus TaxID=439358 RepID=A0AAV7Y222_9NEOP|nr:hypothetical protein ONE63_000353 [Megalurothrips usitatus]
MRVLLVPRDAAVGAVIYRLRATDSDFDYPLHFDVGGDGAGAQVSVVRLDNLPCTRNMSYCQANVVLARKLDAGRVYDVRLRVRDSRGDATSIDAIVQLGNSTTPMDSTFPRHPALIMVPEDTKPGTELDYVIVRKNPRNNRHAIVELWGSPLFTLAQRLSSRTETNASIILAGELDYETQAMYTLDLYALDPYVEPGQDTRNVAAFQVAVVVVDVQDTPPEFIEAPPVTQLSPSLQVGDQVVRVRAEDGDKGKPRQIRYGLVSEGSPFTTFFTVDERTGSVSLARPLPELTAIARPQQPILLTVMAEEVRTNVAEPPAMASTVTLALLLGPAANSPPYFDHPSYVSRIPENSPQGAPLVFGDPYTTVVRDDDMGKNGVFSLSLDNNNGTFEVLPGVAEQRATFVLHVRSAQLLDYEINKVLSFKVVARELTPDSALSATADVMVFVDDVNDNAPVFLEDEYRATVPENVTAGTRIAQVQATDVDTGEFGHVRYTAILGRVNGSLALDPETGVITVSKDKHDFDREVASEYRVDVEARDENGAGLRSTVPLIIRVLDVNDETPHFVREPYELILAPDRASFSSPVFLQATDADAEPPNNQVRYEIISGNKGDHFALDRESGELIVKTPLSPSETVITITVRAYDLGVPLRWTHGMVRVYPPETRARTMVFIVPGTDLDRKATEETLSSLTGGSVTIKDIRPYDGDDLPGSPPGPKSQVTATVLYSSQSVIDVASLEKRLKGNKTAIMVGENVREYREGASDVLFWVLIILAILLALALLAALLCCCCHGCPYYIGHRKGSRVHSTENVRLVMHEQGAATDKGVQAGWMSRRQEAWSASGSGRGGGAAAVNARTGPVESSVPAPRLILEPASLHNSLRGSLRGSRPPSGRSLRHQHQPVKMVALDAAALQHHQTLFVEDVDGGEYRVLDPSRILVAQAVRNHQASPSPARSRVSPSRHHHGAGQQATLPGHPVDDPDMDSLRRHEQDRGSDQADDEDYNHNSARQPLFLREGGAEILRLVTQGGGGAEAAEDRGQGQPGELRPYTHVEELQLQQAPQPQQHGKDIIMRRFMEDQEQQASDGLNSSYHDMLLGQVRVEVAGLGALQSQTSLVQQYLEQQRDAGGGLGASLGRRDSLLQRFLVEEGRRNAEARQRILAALDQQDTQSLPPGHLQTTAAATQTDVDSATQTEPLHLLRPPRREVRSDNDSLSSLSDDEDADRGRRRSHGRHDGAYSDHEDHHHGGAGGSRRRTAYRKSHHRYRRYRRRKDLLRHNIKTPILEENESSFEAADLARRSRAPQVDQVSQTDSHAQVQVNSFELEPVKSLVSVSVGRGGSEEDPAAAAAAAPEDNAEVSAGAADSLDGHPIPEAHELHLLGEEVPMAERTHPASYLDSGYFDMAALSAVKDAVAEAVRELVGEKASSRSPSRSPSRTGLSSRHSPALTVVPALPVEDRRPSPSSRPSRSRDGARHSLGVEAFSGSGSGSGSSPRGGGDEASARSRSRSTDARPPGDGAGRRERDVNGRLDTRGGQQRYVRGDTYMSWYKKKREERERARAQQKEGESRLGARPPGAAAGRRAAATAATPSSTTATAAAPSVTVAATQQRPTPRTNRATEVRRARAADTIRRLDAEASSKADEDTGRRIPLTEVARRVSDEDTIRRLHEEGVLSVVGGPAAAATAPAEQTGKGVAFDDDLDSGIVMSRVGGPGVAAAGTGRKRNQQLMEKRSIFTIAYDEMHTQHIRADSTTPPH